MKYKPFKTYAETRISFLRDFSFSIDDFVYRHGMIFGGTSNMIVKHIGVRSLEGKEGWFKIRVTVKKGKDTITHRFETNTPETAVKVCLQNMENSDIPTIRSWRLLKDVPF